MRKIFLGVCFLFITFGVFWAQEKQPQKGKEPAQTSSPTATAPAEPLQFVISAADKARQNPEPFTQESLANGKSVYLTQCAMCHGKTGNGKGDLANVMHLSMEDLSKPDTLAKRTDGELYSMINSGLGAMPSETNRMNPKTVWDIVNFLRSLEGKTPEKPKGEEPK